MITVRLDPALKAELERLARQRGVTKSEVVRSALERMIEAESRPADERSALDRLRLWIGVSDSGGRQLSRETGRRFREIQDSRHGGTRGR